MPKFDRRRFLAALGLGGASLALAQPGLRSLLAPSVAHAGGSAPPTRVLFWITPQGTVWDSWKMSPPGLGAGTSSASLAALGEGDFSTILRPLHRHREKLLVVEGIARATAIEDIRGNDASGCDNAHHVAQAHLLTCVPAMQRAGSTAIGGGRSIDQVIGEATTSRGRFALRVYGANHQHPYSFVAPGEESPRVSDPRQAFEDLLGIYTPPPDPMDPTPTREARIRAARGSVLDLAASEYDAVIPRMGTEGRAKLERHRDLIRDLERSFAGTGIAPGLSCDPVLDTTGHTLEQLARVSSIALSCDLTRVVTLVAPHLASSEFGVADSVDVHQDLAHNSIAPPFDGGGAYTPVAAAGMTEFNRVYAEHFARLLDTLDSVPEGDGTLLDHTMVIWTSELATGTHALRDAPVVIAGGASGFLRPGRYVRYAQATGMQQAWTRELAMIGPDQSQLYVTAMRAMGMSDDTFGAPRITLGDGTVRTLSGPLTELS